MAGDETTNELMYEVLKKIQTTQAEHSHYFREIKESLLALRNDMHGTRGDVLRQEKALASVEVDIDRIKARLDLNDPSLTDLTD